MPQRHKANPEAPNNCWIGARSAKLSRSGEFWAPISVAIGQQPLRKWTSLPIPIALHSTWFHSPQSGQRNCLQTSRHRSVSSPLTPFKNPPPTGFK